MLVFREVTEMSFHIYKNKLIPFSLKYSTKCRKKFYIKEFRRMLVKR